MTTHPKVSVIMNCFNGEKYVKAAIESVYAQTYPNWEIIFLDNASSDCTPTIAKCFDQRLHYFRNHQTVPLGEARTQALRHASGEYLAFLDSDDLWLPVKLEKQMPLFKNRPELGLVFSDTEIRYADSGRSTSYFKNHRYKPPRGKIFAALLKHYSVPMLTAVIPARTLRSMTQWFDGKYQVCDDFDFFMRLAYAWDCDYVDEKLATCLIHSEATTAKMHRYAPQEMANTIAKLRSQYPDLDNRFGPEINIFLKNVSFSQGKSQWQSGNNQSARAEFRKHLFSPKFFFSYCSTILSYNTFDQIRRILRRQ